MHCLGPGKTNTTLPLPLSPGHKPQGRKGSVVGCSRLPSACGGRGGGGCLSLPSWGLSCLPHGLNGLSLNQGGRCLTGLMRALYEDKSPPPRSHAVALAAVGS